MLTGKNYGTDGWAQIGYDWATYSSNNSFFFAQWTKTWNGSTLHEIDWGQPVVGASYNFSANRYATDSGYIHMLLDGTTEATTGFDPENAWGGSRNAWSLEIQDAGDDTFGDTSNHVDFNNVQTKNASDNWNTYDFTSQATPQPCYTHTNVITPGSDFKAWTDPKSHSC